MKKMQEDSARENDCGDRVDRKRQKKKGYATAVHTHKSSEKEPME